METFDNVKNLPHIHCWMGNEKALDFEAHVEVNECMLSQTTELQKNTKKLLSEKYFINHTTIQFEFDVCRIKDIVYGY